MSAKREQLGAWIGARTGLAGGDLGVRMRSTVFALLGLTTAACLAVVAILAHQGVPFLPSLPLPGLATGDEQVAEAEPVERAPRVVITSDRSAGAGLVASQGAGGREGSVVGPPAGSKPVSPGPANAVSQPAADNPVAAPVAVAEPQPGASTPTPVSTPAPTPAAPPAAPSGSATDAQLSKGKSSKGSSGKRGSSGGEAGTDAAVPSVKKPSAAPVPTTDVPQMTDAEPDPVTDADLEDEKGHGRGK